MPTNLWFKLAEEQSSLLKELLSCPFLTKSSVTSGTKFFQASRTILKIEKMERAWQGAEATNCDWDSIEAMLDDGTQLDGVKRLELASHNVVWKRGYSFAELLAQIFPNLREIDTASLAPHSYPRQLCSGFFTHCPNRSRFKMAKQSTIMNNLHGGDSQRHPHLTDLTLDDCKFQTDTIDTAFALRDPTNADTYMFHRCSNLERLSIKNARYEVYSPASDFRSVSQKMLIKMVRLHPNLRWLRSDLTQENIAMLQEERLDIVFVSN